MKHLTLILVACLSLTGCLDVLRGTSEAEAKAIAAAESTKSEAEAKRARADEARTKQIAQASSNLGPIADVVEAKGQPVLATATRIQKSSIDNALDIPLSLYPAPTVSSVDLLKDAEASLAKYKAQVNVLEYDLRAKNAEAIAAEKKAEAAEAVAKAEKEKADSAARREWWWQIGSSVVGGLVVLAGIAARLGLPYASIVESLLGLINPMVKQRRVTAETGLAAADVGRQAVGVVEQILADKDPAVAAKVMEVVSAATGGKADTLADLFKVAAKAYVTDKHGSQVAKVDSLLNDLRGRVIDTTGGVANTVAAVVKAV